MHNRELLLVDKPVEITSFDVIRILRRRYAELQRTIQDHDFAKTEIVPSTSISGTGKAPKMGHAGTLDPLASGLMLIGVGAGTKKLNTYLKLAKTYDAVILVGESRSTGDMEGVVERVVPVEVLAHIDAQKVLDSMVGTLALPVPAYSAVKQNGVPLYKKARRGQQVAVPIKPMVVTGAHFTGMHVLNGRAHLSVRFDVESGTYIRSLAQEVGVRLGYPATLYTLRRTRIGTFTVQDAQPPDVVML